MSITWSTIPCSVGFENMLQSLVRYFDMARSSPSLASGRVEGVGNLLDFGF